MVPAASSTSIVSMPMRWKISASSFISAMLRSRCVFSMTLAASATLMLEARCTPAVTTIAVDLGDALERLGRVAGDDLHDARQRVLLVAGVDALGRVADEEVLLPLHARTRARAPGRRLPRWRPGRRSTRRRRGALLHVAADGDRSRRRSGEKSGWCASSIGVGTATMMKSASRSARGIGGRLEQRARPSGPRCSPRRSDPRAGGRRRPSPSTDRSRSCGPSCRTRPRAAGRRTPARRRR